MRDENQEVSVERQELRVENQEPRAKNQEFRKIRVTGTNCRTATELAYLGLCLAAKRPEFTCLSLFPSCTRGIISLTLGSHKTLIPLFACMA